jgi:hypothetical protein
MNALLVAYLFTQLSYFQFTPISSPQVAGNQFLITINAKKANGDPEPYGGRAILTTNRDDIFSVYVSPYQVAFVSGVCQVWATVPLACDSIKLKCTYPESAVIGWSNSFQVLPNNPFRYLTILPGESLAPGSVSGKYWSPQNQISGDSFSVATYVTDAWFNPIGLRNDSVRFSGTDPFGIYPSGHLQNGQGVFPISLRRAGNHRIYTHGVTGIRSDTSALFSVAAGPFSQLLIVLPGETLLAGDTTTQVFSTPGKTGRPDVLYVKDTTWVRVVATDACWNRVVPPTDSIRLLSDFGFHSNPVAGWLRDSTLFKAEFDSAGTNQTLWVHDYTLGIESYRCLVDVAQRTDSILIVGPDTIRAGATVVYRATLLDANAEPIAARTCLFKVTNGSGAVLDSVGISDITGVTSVEFIIDSAHFSEVDSIQFTADGYSKRKGVYVEIPDTTVTGPAGRIIAYPNPFGWDQNYTTIFYEIPHSVDVTVAIYDAFGNQVQVRKYRKGQDGAANGLNRIYWDGKTDAGQKVANGIYILKIWGQEHTGIAFQKTYRIGVVR